VFEELHFGRAAARLHISQPPLSQAIRKLEEALGVQLFVRTSRAVEATPAGVILAEGARRAIASFELAVSEAREEGSGDSTLRMGCVAFLPSSRLQLFLTELKKRDEHLQPDVTHLPGAAQVDRLRSGQLDLGVFMNPDDFPELEYEPLFPSEPISAIVSNGDRLAQKPVLRPEDLASATLLTYPRAANPVLYDRYMRRIEDAGFHFRRRHEIGTDGRDVLLAVATGLGVALGPASVVELAEEGQSVVQRPLDPELRYPDMSVAWRANTPGRLLPRLGAVRQAARELYRAAAA
jgi:DNA-binding transcriptional LysR family regulator